MTVVVGDCLRLLPSMRADIILTSPPYYNAVTYGERLPWQSGADYIVWLRHFFALAARSAHNLIIVHQRQFEDLVGVPARQVILVEKYFREYAYVYGDLSYPDCGIEVRPARHPIHPCPFADDVVRYFLDPLPRSWSVLDPFAGVGTTVRVANEMGFVDAKGIEKNAEYVAQAGL